MRRTAVFFAALSAALLLTPHAARAQGADPVTFRNGGTSERRQYEARVRGEVDNLKSRWAQAWEGDNAAALSELYTRDAVLVKQSGEAIRTPAAIRDAFAKELPAAANLQTRAVDFATSGDLAYEVGTMTYVLEAPGSAAEMKSAVYVLVMERQWDSSWKIQSQMLSDPIAQR